MRTIGGDPAGTAARETSGSRTTGSGARRAAASSRGRSWPGRRWPSGASTAANSPPSCSARPTIRWARCAGAWPTCAAASASRACSGTSALTVSPGDLWLDVRALDDGDLAAGEIGGELLAGVELRTARGLTPGRSCWPGCAARPRPGRTAPPRAEPARRGGGAAAEVAGRRPVSSTRWTTPPRNCSCAPWSRPGGPGWPRRTWPRARRCSPGRDWSPSPAPLRSAARDPAASSPARRCRPAWSPRPCCGRARPRSTRARSMPGWRRCAGRPRSQPVPAGRLPPGPGAARPVPAHPGQRPGARGAGGGRRGGRGPAPGPAGRPGRGRRRPDRGRSAGTGVRGCAGRPLRLGRAGAAEGHGARLCRPPGWPGSSPSGG